MPNSLELSLMSYSGADGGTLMPRQDQLSPGIQNSNFEDVPRRRSAYVEAYADMLLQDVAKSRRSLSFVQTKLTKNGCVSALQRADDGAPCWLKPLK